MSKVNDNIQNVVKQDAVNIGGSLVGAMAGLALGGPIGAVVGATTAPVMTMTYNIFERAMERRRLRAAQLIEDAFRGADLSPEQAVNLLNSDDEKTDNFITLIRLATESDPVFDKVLTELLSKALIIEGAERHRLLIIGDAIRNLRPLHLHILTGIKQSGGVLTARGIAEMVQVPEIELRSVVRDLELRGMIKDLEKHPIEWELRELGEAIVTFASNKDNVNDKISK